jgi:hypothetical protein
VRRAPHGRRTRTRASRAARPRARSSQRRAPHPRDQHAVQRRVGRHCVAAPQRVRPR